MKIKELLEDRSGDVKVVDGDVINGKLKEPYGKVHGYFNCSRMGLTTLENGPTEVTTGMSVSFNELTSLEFAPMKVGEAFWAHHNKITSLEGIGKRYLKSVKDLLNLDDNPIKSNVLGILLIKNLDRCTFKDKEFEVDSDIVSEIITKHLRADRDIMEAREELIAAGYKDYAKL